MLPTLRRTTPAERKAARIAHQRTPVEKRLAVDSLCGIGFSGAIGLFAISVLIGASPLLATLWIAFTLIGITGLIAKKNMVTGS